jgi:hypothetical protein
MLKGNEEMMDDCIEAHATNINDRFAASFTRMTS